MCCKVSHAQPGDPNEASGHYHMNLKQCHTCIGMFPDNYFGLAKFSRHGRSTICHNCRSQFLRLRRQLTKGSKSKIDDSVLRNVSIHNKTILTQALATSETMAIWAYQPETKRTFKIVFGIGSLGMKSMAIFDLDGRAFQEHSYSGHDSILDRLTVIVKDLGLRLELTEGDLITAKNLIFFI